MLDSRYENRVSVTDVDIPFGRMVMILLKLMLASIPAVLVFYAIFGLIFLIGAMIFGGGAALLQQL